MGQGPAGWVLESHRQVLERVTGQGGSDMSGAGDGTQALSNSFLDPSGPSCPAHPVTGGSGDSALPQLPGGQQLLLGGRSPGGLNPGAGAGIWGLQVLCTSFWVIYLFGTRD